MTNDMYKYDIPRFAWEYLIDQLEEVMHMATTERDRSVIKNCIEQMGSE